MMDTLENIIFDAIDAWKRFKQYVRVKFENCRLNKWMQERRIKKLLARPAIVAMFKRWEESELELKRECALAAAGDHAFTPFQEQVSTVTNPADVHMMAGDASMAILTPAPKTHRFRNAMKRLVRRQ